MLRRSSPCLARVDRSDLAQRFRYNLVLSRVFSASPDQAAIITETAGNQRPRTYLYGDLQRDVLLTSSRILKSRATLPGDVGNYETWRQKACPSNAIGPFDNTSQEAGGEEEAVAAEKQKNWEKHFTDGGEYNVAIMCSPGYEFAVGVLSAWVLNMMAVPLCNKHHYETEMGHVLFNSRTRTVLCDDLAMHHTFPDEVRQYLQSPLNLRQSPRPEFTFALEHAIDLTAHVNEIHSAHGVGGWNPNPPLEVTVEDAPTDTSLGATKTISSAADVMERFEYEKQAARERKAQLRFSELPKETEVKYSGPKLADVEVCDALLAHINALQPQNATTTDSGGESQRVTSRDDCLMVYTSGTTAKPKGAVHSHKSICKQVSLLQQAWHWCESDRILNVLPVHHIHGLINILFCSLASNATCVFTPFDNATRIARRLDAGDITIFMAVPTVYAKLAAAVEDNFTVAEKIAFRKSAASMIRLMVSGSAALPVPLLEHWRDLSQHTLLERYGMTEIGMALSQPLIGERVPGTVGQPLPGVSAFVDVAAVSSSSESETDSPSTTAPKDSSDESGSASSPTSGAGSPTKKFDKVGHLHIASDSVCSRYWRNPAATMKELYIHPVTQKKFFRTGDTVGVVQRSTVDRFGKSVVEPCFTILGRTSVDIIKRSGYKISALEIEATLLEDPMIGEAAVVGTPHPSLGEEIVAIVAPSPTGVEFFSVEFDESPAADSGIERAKDDALPTVEFKETIDTLMMEKLARYKHASRIVVLKAIPRNTLGKVNKKELKMTLGIV